MAVETEWDMEVAMEVVEVMAKVVLDAEWDMKVGWR